MRTATRRSFTPILLAVAALVVGPGCESSTDPEIDEVFVGDWISTSFTLGGVEQMVPGASFYISMGLYDDMSYQFIVGGDDSGLLCDGPPSCQEQGDYEYTASRITMDPGTADAFSMQYSVSGNVMTLSGSLDGTSFSGSLERR